jgi:acyl-ACP thioesterase
VRSYEVDAAGQLSVLALFNYLQDAASAHARRLGVAIDDLQAAKRTWVLARIFLQMSVYPPMGEKIRVATWPSGVNRVNAYRNFLITTPAGQILGGCLSSWLVIDLIRRRPLRMDPLLSKLRPRVRSPLSYWPLAKIGPAEDAQGQRAFKVRYRDLDVNRHVNNATYVEWLLESLPRKVSRRQVLAALHITFMGEAFADQRAVACWRAATSVAGGFEHSIRNIGDNRELVRAQSIWRPAAAGGTPPTLHRQA